MQQAVGDELAVHVGQRGDSGFAVHDPAWVVSEYKGSLFVGFAKGIDWVVCEERVAVCYEHGVYMAGRHVTGHFGSGDENYVFVACQSFFRNLVGAVSV